MKSSRLIPVAWLAVIATPAAAQTDETLLVRGGTIHTAVGAPIRNGAILLRGGKIVAIGTSIAAPAGARIIDATGKDIVPGMIDNHSHIGARPTDINDFPKLIGPEHRFLDALDWNDPDFKDAIEGGVTTIVTGPGSGENVGCGSLDGVQATGVQARVSSSSRTTGSSPCPVGRSCSVAATCTASPSSNPPVHPLFRREATS